VSRAELVALIAGLLEAGDRARTSARPPEPAEYVGRAAALVRAAETPES
jgi:hypothetical protein